MEHRHAYQQGHQEWLVKQGHTPFMMAKPWFKTFGGHDAELLHQVVFQTRSQNLPANVSLLVCVMHTAQTCVVCNIGLYILQANSDVCL